MSERNYIDLHSHSSWSLDGQFSSKELIDMAIHSGIKYYALSDHDDVSGLEEAINYSKGKDITVIPATELSAIINETQLHVLGYNIDYNNPFFKQRRQEVYESLKSWNKQIIQNALDYGFYFDLDKLLNKREDHLVYEGSIGQAILEDPRNDNNEQLLPFRKGHELSNNPSFNFFRTFFAQGKPLFVPYNFNLPIKEAEKVIHESGGKMFLAHPFHNLKYNEDLLKQIIDIGLDGIEVFSSYHNQEGTNFYYQMAKKYNLYMSVGSDFHGKSKPSIKMGSINYDETELIKTLKYLNVYHN